MAPNRSWIAPVLYMAMIITLSSIPGSTGPDSGPGPASWIPPILSNALHVPVYAGLSFLWAWTLIGRGHNDPRIPVLIALIIAVVFGAIDESYQNLTPGRTTALFDWIADSIGATAGCIVFILWRRRSMSPK